MSNSPNVNTGPIEIPGIPGSDLTRVEPTEVVALDAYLDGLRNSGFDDTSEAVRERLQEVRPHVAFALECLIDTLPDRNLEFGRAVLTAFANSPLHDYRGEAARCIVALTRADHDYGLALWDRLVRDESHFTRSYATEEIDAFELARMASISPDALYGDLPITWQEAKHLAARREKAERGEDLVHIERPKGFDEELYRLQQRVSGYLAYLKVANIASSTDS